MPWRLPIRNVYRNIRHACFLVHRYCSCQVRCTFCVHRRCTGVGLVRPLDSLLRGILVSDFTSYEGVSKSFRTESITKCSLTTINTRWKATQRVMTAKLTRLTHKIAIQLHLVAESFTICGSRSRRPVRKLLETPSYSRWVCFGA
jgi:hypothetical protein